MYLFLDMNSYFAACEQQVDRNLRGRPVAVVPMGDVSTTCVIAASYEAKAFGVKTGTSVPEARQLCPHILLVPQQPRLYRQMHRQIVRTVEGVLPDPDVLSVDEMVCRLWRNEAHLADALAAGASIQDAIRSNVGDWMSCSVGIAPNAHLAKVASDFQKPRGLSVITPDDIPRKLYRLDLMDWPGIARRMRNRFAMYNVRTTESMYQLDIKAMRNVFGGIVGERWWRMIRGQQVALPPLRREQIGHSNVLAPEFRTPKGSWSIACRLLEKCCERARGEGFLARKLSIEVSDFEGGYWSRTIRVTATNRTLELMDVLGDIWDEEEPLRRPSHVSVALRDIILRQDMTLGLFDDPKLTAADVAADHINQRFGRGMLTSAAALESKEYLDHARIPFGKPTEMR